MSGEQLERRYRGLLRVLPKSYRDAREEELLSVLMDGAAEGRRWPELREVFSMARLSLRARVRGAGDGAVGGLLERTRLGEMSRLVGVLGSVILAYVGVLQLALVARNLHMSPGYSLRQVLNPFSAAADTLVRHRLGGGIAQIEVPACWLVVLTLLAIGWWQAARGLALAVLALSAYLAGDLHAAMYQEVALAAVTTAALFAARGPHARPARVPGLAAVAALIGVMCVGYWTEAEPLARGLLVLKGRGYTDGTHAFVAVAVLVAAVCVVAYRSVVWPVALAVVSLAVLGPAVAAVALVPETIVIDVIPLLVLACALVVVAGLAVLKERRSQRSAADRGELSAS